ncbi:MAG: MATE family efflux transporter [Butyrivibrio sp.]
MNERKLFYKNVIMLMLPIALQNLINVGISSIDVIMLGRVGEDVLSGASLGSQINFIMSLFLFGLMSGSSVLIAQYWGKKDSEPIKTVFGIAMKVSAMIGIIFFAVTMAIPGTLMRIFTNDPQVIGYGVEYLRIVCWSYLMIPLTMTYLNTMRSMEEVIVATVAYLASMVTNIIVNAFLIFGIAGLPKLGIRGAAIGTVVARAAELIIVIIHNCVKNKTLPFRFSYLTRKNRLLWKDFLSYSVPVMANELIWGAGVSAISAVLGHMGSPVVAANSVAQVVRQLAMVVGFGISSTTAIMLGKTIGAGEKKLAELYAKRFLFLSVATGILGAVVVLIARPICLATLVLTPQARKYLNFMMYIMSYFVIGQSVNTTIVVGICRSGGDTRFGLVLDTVFLWGVAILGGFLSAFVFKWGVYVTYIILLSDEVIKVPITLWRYRTKKWLKNVTR